MADENTENQVEETTETSAAEAEAPVAPAAEAEAPETTTEEPAPTEAEQTEEPTTAAEPEAPVAPAAKQRSRRHVPRRDRRQRPRPARERIEGQRKPITRQSKPEGERGRRQERRGVVVSSAMDKTIVVKVDMIKLHPRYKKVIRRSQKFHAHDEQNQANVGDVVRIVETRPLSKTKTWRLAEVVEVAK
jgi:small subunit ribosomal protein S17